MYRLATVHFVTDRQTNRRQCHDNSRSYCLQQVNRLKIENNFYRAMLRRARSCHSMSSVCISVCPSVRDVQIPWSHRLEYFKK